MPATGDPTGDEDDDDGVGDYDRDMPLESDMDADDEDGPAVMPCPHCGKQVHEDAEWCHHCGQFLSREDAPPTRAAVWILVTSGVVLAIVIFWLMGR